MYNNLDEQQYRALGLALSGQALWITGGAGTGKSHLIRYISTELQLLQKNVVILAPTGLAAFNVAGQTCHSFYGFRDDVLDERNTNIATPLMQKKLQAIDTLILDEVSMCRSDTFTAMERLLRLSTGTDIPWGGKQIIVVGDYYQLPPVVPDELIKDYLNKNFNGIYAFNTDAWQEANFSVINLVNIYRQKDIDYLNMLNDIRLFTPQAMQAIDVINSYCQQLKAYQRDDNSHINLCCRNRDANQINLQYLSELPGQEYIYPAEIFDYVPHDFNPVSRHLSLKVGARVILLKNSFNHSNGSMGYVTELSENSITVKLDYGNSVYINPDIFEYKEYELEGDSIISVTKGVIRQFPIAIGKSISIHKSQGMGFDKVNVVTGNSGCFEQGQLYTALSRVTSLSGLRLANPIQLWEALPNEQIQNFYHRLY